MKSNPIRQFQFLGLFLLSMLCLPVSSIAQVANDECITAQHLGNIQQFCTVENEYGTVGATPSPQAQPTCWPNADHDVWFSFVPQAPGVYVQLIGKQILTDLNVLMPSLAIYSGNCNNLTQEACESVLFGDNVLELTLVDAVIGQTYYLRVDARDDNIGNFRLCLESFNPVPSPEADCPEAVTLCNKDPFFIDNLAGVGMLTNEVQNTCIQEEFASVWYNWTCENAGTLTFVLEPNNETDDLDFAVFRLPNGLSDCSNKELLRCMASGETVGAGQAANAPCAGLTGLSTSSVDTQEQPGCAAGDDNFVAALNMVAGESYALIVNNFSQSGSGFSIEFGGTGTFLGPQADFEVTALQEFECDKTIEFMDLSNSNTDQIVSWSWNFGVGADPVFATGQGPHDVIYDSFGDKLAALTIESTRGCKVTHLLDFFVEPCCQDTSNLAVDAVIEDLICYEIPEGTITASGTNGNPVYQYSLDGVNFQPSPFFPGLAAGDYLVYIQDRKGCRDSTLVMVDQPPEIIVDAGLDQETIFGCPVDFDASYEPNIPVTVNWTPSDNFSCVDCLDPNVLPFASSTYMIQVTDDDGCTATDEVQVFVDDQRPVYPPNIFSPNNDGINEFFNVFAGKAAVGIEEFYVFDRWGNRIFYSEDVVLNDPQSGWDGKFKGDEMNPGMFSWLVSIRYIDGQLIEYFGDITLIR